MKIDPDRPTPDTEASLDYCPACGNELETRGGEFEPTKRVCPEHGPVTIDFQPQWRDRGYAEFDGAIRSPEWIRCPKCAHVGVHIPADQNGRNVYFACPDCGQRGIVS